MTVIQMQSGKKLRASFSLEVVVTSYSQCLFFIGPTSVEGDGVSGGLEIVVPTDGGHKGKGKR